VDNRSEFGGDDLGASPMELVLMEWRDAFIDMISILKKQRQELVLSKLR
jgi:putative redox protein